jgi:vitamin K-dependent gamma-carboxylase
MDKLKYWLSETYDGRRISIFRFFYGAFMCYQMIYYLKIKLVEVGFLGPELTFPYTPFDFIGPLSSGLFKALLLLMMVAAIMIAIGFKTRWAALFFGLGFMYTVLLEKAYYNNHLYLFGLIAFWFAIIESEKHYSLSTYLSGKTPASPPRWHLFILQYQIVLVYFYGGIAKLSKDWLVDFEPVKSASNYIKDGVWYDFVKNPTGLKSFMYGGLVVDLIFSLMMFHKRLKWVGLVGLIAFNFMNSSIFNDIGIFPYVMLSSLLLFFDGHDLSKLSSSITPMPSSTGSVSTSKGWKYTVIAIFLIQMIIPFRGYLFSKNMDWTGIHQSFSWRMKSMTREVKEMKFTIIDSNGNEQQIEHGKIINNLQVDLIAREAGALLRFARHLRQNAIANKAPNPKVKAKILVSFNGRPPQDFVNPNVDLADPRLSVYNTSSWLMPLQE